MKKWLTREEAMAYLRISAIQMSRLTSEKKVTYYQAKPGARIMFLEEDLERYMENMRICAAAPARGAASIVDLSGTYRKRRVAT